MADITVTAAQIGAVFPADAEIRPVILAATVTAGQALYLTSSGTYNLADANDSGAQQFRGVALNGGAAGQAVDMLRRGEVYGYTLAGAHDDLVYLSNTAGALSTDAGAMTVQCGRLTCLTDADLTKVVFIDADMKREWA